MNEMFRHKCCVVVLLMMMILSRHAESVGGKFQLIILSFNPQEPCTPPCNIFFRFCLSSYQSYPINATKCKLGENITTPIATSTLNNIPRLKQYTEDVEDLSLNEVDDQLLNNVSQQFSSIQKTPSFTSHPSINPFLFVFHFDFRWTGDFAVVVEAWQQNNQGEKILQLRHSSSYLKHFSSKNWTFLHENYENGQENKETGLRFAFNVACPKDRYGPNCTYCTPQNSQLGHFTCGVNGEKLCLPGWTDASQYCRTAVCEGCKGSCIKPGHCRCDVGWKGDKCDECIPKEGCLNGYCEKALECKCKDFWSGDLCDQLLNEIECQNRGICQNGGTCLKSNSKFICRCPAEFTGKQCEISLQSPTTRLPPSSPSHPFTSTISNNVTQTNNNATVGEDTTQMKTFIILICVGTLTPIACLIISIILLVCVKRKRKNTNFQIKNMNNLQIPKNNNLKDNSQINTSDNPSKLKSLIYNQSVEDVIHNNIHDNKEKLPNTHVLTKSNKQLCWKPPRCNDCRSDEGNLKNDSSFKFQNKTSRQNCVHSDDLHIISPQIHIKDSLDSGAAKIECLDLNEIDNYKNTFKECKQNSVNLNYLNFYDKKNDKLYVKNNVLKATEAEKVNLKLKNNKNLVNSRNNLSKNNKKVSKSGCINSKDTKPHREVSPRRTTIEPRSVLVSLQASPFKQRRSPVKSLPMNYTTSLSSPSQSEVQFDEV